MNEKLYYVFREITEKTGSSLSGTGICVPTSTSDAEATFLSGKRAIYKNMPSPKVHIIDQHACFKLTDLISLHLAKGRDAEYTSIPNPEEDRTNSVLITRFMGLKQWMM